MQPPQLPAGIPVAIRVESRRLSRPKRHPAKVAMLLATLLYPVTLAVVCTASYSIEYSKIESALYARLAREEADEISGDIWWQATKKRLVESAEMNLRQAEAAEASIRSGRAFPGEFAGPLWKPAREEKLAQTTAETAQRKRLADENGAWIAESEKRSRSERVRREEARERERLDTVGRQKALLLSPGFASMLLKRSGLITLAYLLILVMLSVAWFATKPDARQT